MRTHNQSEQPSMAEAHDFEHCDSVVGRIHRHHLAMIRHVTDALATALEIGARLRDEQAKRGDDFDSWVERGLALSPAEAAVYIDFHETSGLQPEAFAPHVATSLSELLPWLGRLDSLPETASPAADTAPPPAAAHRRKSRVKGQPGRTEQTAEHNPPASNAASIESGTQQSAGDPFALTDTQKRFLVKRSPRLFMRVNQHKLSAKAALQHAAELPVPPRAVASEQPRQPR